jgi:predicted N-acyltransferase/GNAT superfamily N-acetyltransferase
VATPPDLEVRVVDTVHDIPATRWDALAGPDELYLCTAWMRMLEATNGTAMHYLLAYESDDLIGGLATAHAEHTAPWRSGRPDALLERCVRERRAGAAEFRGRLPQDLTTALLPGLVCGGRHLGRNRVVARDSRHDPAPVRRLVEAAESLARSRECRSISFLYVDEQDRALPGVLADRGYHRYVSAQYNVLPVPAGGYAGYQSGLSSHRRRRIAADRRRLRGAGVAVELEPLTAEVIPRMAELETALFQRYDLTWSPALSEVIFSKIYEEFGGTALLSTARIAGRLTGFILLVPRGASWYAHRAGFDYPANGNLPVYFDVTYNRPLELAPSHGATSIHYGTGSDATKESRGCVSTVQYAYTLVLDREPARRGTDRRAEPERRSTMDTRARTSSGRHVIEMLDPFHERSVAQLHRLLAAVTAADLPDQPAPCPLDTAGATRFAWPQTRHEDRLARIDGQVVGAVRVLLPTSGTTTEGRIDHLVVHPDRRRQGIGTALFEAARTAAGGLSGLTGLAPESIVDGVWRDPGPGLFATAMGADRRSHLVHLRLDIAAHRAEHAEWLAAVRRAIAGYTLIHWGSVVPAALLPDAAELSARLAGTDATAHAERIRGLEQMRTGRQRHAWETGVRHDGTGRLVAMSSMTMTHSVADSALQGTTVVHPEHRGRGLGTLAKLANLAHAVEHEPALRTVDTYNEATNEPVLALNRKLHLRHVDDVVTWRVKV